MRTGARAFVASWYLLGWLFHVYLVQSGPDVYSVFGRTGLLPGYVYFWQTWIMPSIVIWALLLAAFELVVGLMIIWKDPIVKWGLILSIVFNLFLVQMGLAYPAADWLQDIVANRLPNLVFIAIQVPLLWGEYKVTLVDMVRRRFSATR